MDAVRDAWSLSRTMQITIRDDTYRDVNNWCALPKSFIRKFGIEDSVSGSFTESKLFVLMIEPEDTIAAVKAYIQAEKDISFKKQKLLRESDGALREAQTLSSMGMSHGSLLILRYAPIMRITVTMICGKSFKLMVESDGTLGDVKEFIQEKEGTPCHRQRLMYNKREILIDSDRLSNLGIQYDDVLHICLK
ncbi:hypothetical protein H5410_050193 [Solanum commersonii]|uniref:Ubiquitin-like domain-containing protein n=1 Tax=Solanum commersonii TaxID=4109 RepID=A0A9J5WX92_SOLCO|nr:hypothetical protein H5410_050193 [Solanum commersonii]